MTKKEFIEQAILINSRLDTLRTNLNILIYNLFQDKEDKLKLPDYDFLDLFNKVNALSNAINPMAEDHNNKKIANKEVKK